MSRNNINLSGEFYAMHVLFRRGYVPALTLGNTKGVDILLYNPTNERQFKVEVKTSSIRKNQSNFGGDHIGWRMAKKHEDINLPDLVYCFVYIPPDITYSPQIFFVPCAEVSHYVRWEHEHWLLNIPHKREVRDTEMRTFRICTVDFARWENNFTIFE